MPASQVLQQLYALEPSSPDFLRVLYALIKSDEDEQYSSTLEGAELTQLVNFLDKVRHLPSALRPVTNETSKALCSIHTTDDVFRQCLRKLRAICGTHATLPSSHIISGALTRIGVSAIAYGGFADVWHGEYAGRKVCIKALRVSQNDTKGLRKVRTRSASTHRRLRYSRSFLGAAVIFQRGRGLETVEAPKHRSFPWCHHRSPAICVRVDAKRHSNRLHHGKSRRESDRLGEFFLQDLPTCSTNANAPLSY